MSSGRLLIASGADRSYYPLLRDTVLSIRAQRQEQAIGILDLFIAAQALAFTLW